jgi:hypothetical protein
LASAWDEKTALGRFFHIWGGKQGTQTISGTVQIKKTAIYIDGYNLYYPRSFAGHEHQPTLSIWPVESVCANLGIFPVDAGR